MIGSLRDTRTMLSGVTIARAGNAARILTSFYRSRATGHPMISGLPTAISIEPTTSCNLRCPECPSGLRSFTRPTGMLNESLFNKVIDELQETLSYLTFYFQGEPYLHPRFLPMVGHAQRKGIYTATSTNAHYLTEENALKTVASGLSRLIISIDGTTQETYESYRVGGSLEKVLNGAKNIVEAKRRLKSATPHTVFQFLVVKPNEHQVNEVHKLAKEIGIDQVVLKTAQIYDYENGSSLIPSDSKYSRYERSADGRYQIKNKMLDHCWKMWHSCVITWDGKVVPCCFDKDAKYVMGDLHTSSFSEIWNGKLYNEFRRQLLKSRKEIEMCRNCTEGTAVWT